MAVCNAISSGATILTTTPRVLGPKFLLPECFFNSSQLVSISLYSVIVQASASFADPFERLAMAMNKASTTMIAISFSTFLPPTDTDTTPIGPNWEEFLGYFPILEQVLLPNNNLGGTLPEKLPSSIRTFSLYKNRVSGSIPPTLLQDYVSITSSLPQTYVWQLGLNNLTGTIPPSLLTSVPAYSTIFLTLDGSGITGTIPRTLLSLTHSSTIRSVAISFGTLSLVDTIPADLWGLPSNMPELTRLTITLSSPSLSGTISAGWMSQYSFPSLSSISISLANSNLSRGTFTGLLPASAPQMTSYTLDLSNNPLQTSMPSYLLSNMLSFSAHPTSRCLFNIALQNCSLTGILTLPTPPDNLSVLAYFYLISSHNSLAELVVNTNVSKYLNWLDVSYNGDLQGRIDNLFSSSWSYLSVLDVRYTSLGGTMPNMALMDTSSLAYLRMDGVLIDFCGGLVDRQVWNVSTPSTCSLQETDANRCSSLYPQVCSFSPLAPVGTTPPPAPIPTIEIPTPSPCPQSTRPSLQFQCINGIWVSNTTVTTPTLTIPSGASETIIVGDIESSSIVFSGLGSTLTIEGCALNLTSITLILTPDDLKGSSKIVQQLIIFANSNCSNDNLNGVAIEGHVSGSTCRKVKASKTISNGQLSGIFTIDSSPCNTWWIILVSVICGVVVLGVLILVLLIIFVPKVRFAVRPYSRPRDDKDVTTSGNL